MTINSTDTKTIQGRVNMIRNAFIIYAGYGNNRS